MGQVSTSVQEWITRYTADLTAEGTPHRFELWHATEEGGVRLETMVLADYEEGTDPADLAQELWDTSEKDAGSRTVGMVQRYVIMVFRNQGDTENEAQLAFNLQGRSTVGNVLGGDTDRPNDKGLLGQLMRHTEALQQMLNQQTEISMGRTGRELDRSRQRVEFLETKLGEMHDLREELLDRQHERELDRAREEARARRHEEMMTLVMSLGQLAAAKFLGPAGAAVAGNMPAQAARDGAIAKLLANMTQEEVAGVLGALRPNNQSNLLALYASYKEDFEAEQSKRPEMLRDGSTQENEEEGDAEEGFAQEDHHPIQ